MESFIVNSINRFKKYYLDNKELLPLLILLPTILGGILQTVQLLFIGPEYIRFFSITQLVSDGILILSILSIIYLSYLFLKKFYNFKPLLTKLTPPNTNLNYALRKFGFTLFMNILIFVFLYALKLYKYEIEFSIGWILIHSFFVFFVLPSIIELLILICFFLIRFIVFILIKWKGIGKVETYFKDKEKVIADLDPYINALSVILLIPVIVVIFGSFILLIQFSISTNNPHKLANLECVSSLVKDKFGENQNSKILYFNDKYFFVKIKDPNSDKNDDRIVLFETENILFIDNCR